jgi:hypothetical protein
LRDAGAPTTMEIVENEPVLYREEVLEIMGALADLRVDVAYIRGFFEEEDDEDEVG